MLLRAQLHIADQTHQTPHCGPTMPERLLVWGPRMTSQSQRSLILLIRYARWIHLACGRREVLGVFCCFHSCFLNLASLCINALRPPATRGSRWAMPHWDWSFNSCLLDWLLSHCNCYWTHWRHQGTGPEAWAYALSCMFNPKRTLPLSYVQHHQDILCYVLWRRFEPPLEKRGRVEDVWLVKDCMKYTTFLYSSQSSKKKNK